MKLFRAWDTKKKKWFGENDPNCLKFYDFAIFGECTEFFRPSIDYLQHLIITQYLFIDDYNNKKVYEGDIIEYGDFTITKDGRLNKILKTHAIGIDVEAQTGISFLRGLQQLCIPFRVIGNIFKNPEMLEVKNANS